MGLRFDVFIGLLSCLLVYDRVYDGFIINWIFSIKKYLEIGGIIIISFIIIFAIRYDSIGLMKIII